MSDYSDLKLMATHAIGWTDMSLAPDVVLDLIKDAERYAHLKAAWQDDFLIAYLDSNVHPCGWDDAIDAHMNRSPENP